MINRETFKLSVIIPCFNEIKTLMSLIDKVEQSLNFHNYSFYEILLVDDFSTDGSKELIKKKFFVKKKLKLFFMIKIWEKVLQ